MSEKFNYRVESPVDQEEPNEETVEFGISKKDWLEIQNIAHVVGGDFKTEVKLGKPGGGSFTDLEARVITLDPINIKDKPIEAKFVAGHEGSHRAISPGPKEIGLSRVEIEGLYSQIGFGYTQNIIEDPAINGWLGKKFPGLESNIKSVYDEQLDKLDKTGGVIGTPEVKRITAQLGYHPKFAQYGTEVMRDWHSGELGKKLDPDVKKSLRRTIDDVREIIKIIPDVNSADRRAVIEKGVERFQAVTDKVWPEVKKLVEMDLKTEEKRQMMDDFMKKQKELEGKERELEGAQKEGDKGKEEQLKKDIDKLKQELAPFEGMSSAQKEEFEEKVKEAIENGLKQLSDEIEGKNQDAKEANEKKEKAEEELKDLKDKLDGASQDEKKDIEKQIKEKEEEITEQGARAEKAEKELEEIEEEVKSSGGDAIPFPKDALSPELNRTIEKILNGLPTFKRFENRQKAVKQLEEFEDAIKEHIDSKDVPPTHKEMREEIELEKEAARKTEQERAERDRAEKELDRKLKESMSPYERARAEVAGQIDDLYHRLRRILKPEEYGSEESGYSSGQRLDVTRAMQAEHDFVQKQKMFIRETLPGKKDYRFWHLVDLSNSMAGEKIAEAYKGFIIAGEAVDRLEDSNSDTVNIHQGITGFHERVFNFKDTRERFSTKTEKRLSTMPSHTMDDDSSTNTLSGTKQALEGLEKDLGETGNYLLTFTDGQPNYDVIEPLKKLLKEGKAERDAKHIKIGLIWLGQAGIDDNMLKAMVKEYGYDFGMVMPVPKKGGAGKKETFSEKLGQLLEGLVKNPEMY